MDYMMGIMRHRFGTESQAWKPLLPSFVRLFLVIHNGACAQANVGQVL